MSFVPTTSAPLTAPSMMRPLQTLQPMQQLQQPLQTLQPMQQLQQPLQTLQPMQQSVLIQPGIVQPGDTSEPAIAAVGRAELPFPDVSGDPIDPTHDKVTLYKTGRPGFEPYQMIDYVSDQPKVPPPTLYIDPNRYEQLQKLKDRYEESTIFKFARDYCNPYEKLSYPYQNRAGMKLRNIDSIYQLFTNPAQSPLLLRQPGPFYYAAIAEGPGAGVGCIQDHRPDAHGYGITLKNTGKAKLDWDRKSIDMTKFDAYYGDDGTGDLYTNWKSFTKYVMSKVNHLGGVDLVIADGGFDVSGDDYDKQEVKTAHLFFCEVVTAIGVLREGGSFVCKVFDTVTRTSADIIHLCCMAFKNVTMFKPVTSRPANSERYMVCTDFKADSRELLKQLDAVDQAFMSVEKSGIASQPVSIFGDTAPILGTGMPTIFPVISSRFIKWLTRQNEISINRQIVEGTKIINMMAWIKGEYLDGSDLGVDSLERPRLTFNKDGRLVGVHGAPDLGIPKINLLKCYLVFRTLSQSRDRSYMLRDTAPSYTGTDVGRRGKYYSQGQRREMKMSKGYRPIPDSARR